MRFLFCFLLAMMIAVQPAVAASCYTPDQYRAEQAIRFHTRLMVVGMLCQGMLGRSAYADYQHFTTRNQNVIHEQENRLIHYFKQVRKPNPERALHSFRTDLANVIARQASASAIRFCQTYAGQWRQAKTMQPQDFKGWIAAVTWSKPAETTNPVCTTRSKI